ncbi:MAG TPA: endonuclease/exonuclease/phosphatase family protein [Candidatus Brocadiia bacterium]|nr:endonuclease/exonuclease/phosphatase family protein [Candidatus Brocadiia bacterium]
MINRLPGMLLGVALGLSALFMVSCAAESKPAADAPAPAAASEALSPAITTPAVAVPAETAPAGPAAPIETAAAKKANLKLLAWNVQLLPTTLSRFAKSLQKQQELRAPWIVEYLNAQDYDVVVLQEVIDKRATEKIKEGLKASYPYIIAPVPEKGVAGASGGNLIASRIPMKYVAHIVFENVAGVDRIATKGCVIAEGEKDGVIFQIVGTHLQAGHQEEKDKQYVEMGDKVIKPHRRDAVPQILAGDFNTDEGTDKFEMLLGATGMRAYPMTDPRPFTIDPENSWSRPGKRLGRPDHIFLNPCGTGSTIIGQTVQRARREHEGKIMDLSDHYGLIAEIVLMK